MKIIVTGSLGNIGKPLTEQLVQKGHSVTVISSKAERQKSIEDLGAKAAIGSIENVDFLTETFDLISKGLPTVQYLADNLKLSPGYLSSLLKALTGQSTQHHIHEKLIEKAKEKLSTSNLTVSEIAYALGFEHSQSFSKLFKTKTNLTPLEFRQSFN